MKKISLIQKINTPASIFRLKKLFLLIPLFLLNFALFITCIKLIQKKILSYNDYTDSYTTASNVQPPYANGGNLQSTCADEGNLQSSLANNVIRLHVIANSDSDSDQKLKYKVRNSIIEKLRLSLIDVKNIKDAEHIINGQLTDIERTALNTINENGYGYSVNAQICNRKFPVKTYGDLTFPAGEYRSLCIEIGDAKGKNWWCVLFPSLCFVDSTTAIVPDASKELLREQIGNADYNKLEEYSHAMAGAAQNNENANNSPEAYVSQKSDNTDITDTANEQKQENEPSLEVHSAIYDRICGKLK